MMASEKHICSNPFIFQVKKQAQKGKASSSRPSSWSVAELGLRPGSFPVHIVRHPNLAPGRTELFMLVTMKIK